MFVIAKATRMRCRPRRRSALLAAFGMAIPGGVGPAKFTSHRHGRPGTTVTGGRISADLDFPENDPRRSLICE
jgi:hypothetical protein